MYDTDIINDIKYIDILLPLPFNKAFTYSIDKNTPIEKGQVVAIKFRNKDEYGVVLNDNINPQNIKIEKIKKIEKIISLPKFNQTLIQFIINVSKYTMTPLGLVLKASLLNTKDLISVHNCILYNLNPLILKEDIDLPILYKKCKDFKPRSLDKISKITDIPDFILKKYIDRNILIEYKTGSYFDYSKIKITNLTPEQKDAYNILKEKYLENNYSATLLDGITGSGKTEVFFQLIEYILQNDSSKQILILLPEIALTSQLINRFQDKFGFTPNLWHSNLTQKQRAESLNNIITRKARLTIGARSALFLPYENLGLIIIDEEHDQSFKQEEQFIYHARDMAVLRANIENIPIILSSATPSIETIANVKRKKYATIKLHSRYGEAGLPNIHLIDLKQEKTSSKNFISSVLKKEIEKTLDQNLQVLLFLNRKGYAPLKLCQQCGHRFSCPNCSTWLVEYKKPPHLCCHHCGYVKEIPRSCPECNSKEGLIAFGPGIEKIAEEVQSYFPDARISLISSEVTSSMKKISTIIDEIITGKIDIIIGTQSVVKGHHFPKLTTVGVIDGDMILAGGDLRASERCYQLLHQVAGRAGREDLKGNVFIQTYAPQNQLMQAIANLDTENFINSEIKLRHQFNLPPFAKQIALIISSQNELKLKEFIQYLSKNFIQNQDTEILGPSPALLYKINKNFRYRFLLKSAKSYNLQNYVDNILKNTNTPNYIKIKIDVDPVSFC